MAVVQNELLRPLDSVFSWTGDGKLEFLCDTAVNPLLTVCAIIFLWLQ